MSETNQPEDDEYLKELESYQAISKDINESLYLPNIESVSNEEARKEELAFTEHTKKINNSKLRNIIFRVLLIAGVTIVSITVLIRIIHALIPRSCHWLDDTQLAFLDTFFISSLFGGFISKNIGKIFGIAEG